MNQDDVRRAEGWTLDLTTASGTLQLRCPDCWTSRQEHGREGAQVPPVLWADLEHAGMACHHCGQRVRQW